MSGKVKQHQGEKEIRLKAVSDEVKKTPHSPRIRHVFDPKNINRRMCTDVSNSSKTFMGDNDWSHKPVDVPSASTTRGIRESRDSHASVSVSGFSTSAHVQVEFVTRTSPSQQVLQVLISSAANSL